MLCWGDLVWVPFTYTLPALYLVRHPHGMPWWAVAGVVACSWRASRSPRRERHRSTRSGGIPTAPLKWWGGAPEYVATRRGPLLLASGFWGMAAT